MSRRAPGSGHGYPIPPATVLARRPPPGVRLLARAATLAWWLVGLAAAVASVLVVVEPIDGRQLATRLAFAGAGLFAVATSVGLVTSSLAARVSGPGV